MSNLRADYIVDITDKDVNLVGLNLSKLWADFSMLTVTITAAQNVSSLTDLGTGRPQLNITSNLINTTGASFTECQLYASGSVFPVQKHARITSTSTVVMRLGSNNTALADWYRVSGIVIGTIL